MNPKSSSKSLKVGLNKNTKASNLDEILEQNHQKQYEYCKVCKLNNNQGRCHVYFPKHKKALSLFLSRFRAKLVDEVFFFLKNPFLLRPEHDSLNRLWCVFCDLDIVEYGSSFACENVITHLASLEHLKQVKGFLWKYGSAIECANSFCISEADLAKWEKNCKSLMGEVVGASGESSLGSLNDIHNETNSDYINIFNKNDRSFSFNFNFSNGVIPLQNPTNETSQELSLYDVTGNGCQSHDVHASIATAMNTMTPNTLSGSFDHQSCNSSLPMDSLNYGSVNLSVVPRERIGISDGSLHATSNRQSSSQGLLSLAQISSSVQGNGGNVHSGAPPPWFNAAETNELPRKRKPGVGEIVASQVRPLKSTKLNPKRVGAAWAEKRKIELELEKRGEVVMSEQVDTDWLPNFGRVWQSGCRRESRKEFQVENRVPSNAGNEVGKPLHLKPYISKRMVSKTSLP